MRLNGELAELRALAPQARKCTPQEVEPSAKHGHEPQHSVQISIIILPALENCGQRFLTDLLQSNPMATSPPSVQMSSLR